MGGAAHRARSENQIMVMLATTSILVIFCGVYCNYDAEFAWRVYEWDCRQMGFTPPRLRNWRARVQQVGLALVALGMVGVMAAFGGL
jgi:hypothetical protein